MRNLSENHVLLSSVERYFQVAMECVLDIGNYNIAEKGWKPLTTIATSSGYSGRREIAFRPCKKAEGHSRFQEPPYP